ncbi:hypothetical protein QAD02_008629 [Eretmocerus hayati]|uniref:Uncharacterized protein n=1 Tax=Eretmocerus hayati TaxID=131215 RepID=A0ACC2N7D0_9HYME|nr:hypothetical protein QAD02_008629 [Eretmocerus hayati]
MIEEYQLRILSKIFGLIFILPCQGFEGVRHPEMHQILEDPQLHGIHQVMIVTNTERENVLSTFKQSSCVLQTLASKLPSVIIDHDELDADVNIRLSKMASLRRPRSSTIVVICLNMVDVSPRSAIEVLKKLIKISPVSQRSKCLLVINAENMIEDGITEILKSAWHLKFLDISIIQIWRNETPVLINYNPFGNIYSSIVLNETNQLFPSKLNDLRGAPLKLIAFSSPPFIVMQVEDGKVKISGTEFTFLEILSEKLNSSLNFVLSTNTSMMHINDHLDKLETNEINVSTETYLVRTHIGRKEVVIGKFIRGTEFVVVFPLQQTTSINFSYNTVLSIISLPVILISLFVCTKFIFPPNRWNLVRIFQILLGVSSRHPSKRIERVVFLTMAISSIIYSTTFFSNLTEIRFVLYEKDFSSIRDLVQSGMKIFSATAERDSNDKEIQLLFSNTIKIKSYAECINKMEKIPDSACILSYEKALYYTFKEALNVDGIPTIKIASPTFCDDHVVFVYEKASPFAEKFDEILQRIIESGIPVTWESKVMPRLKRFDEESSKASDILFKELIVIITVGYFVSVKKTLGPKAVSYYANVGMVAFAANGIRKDVVPDTPSSTNSSGEKYKIIIAEKLLTNSTQKEIASTEPSRTSTKMTTRISMAQSYRLRSSQPPDVTTWGAVQSTTKPIKLISKSTPTTIDKNEQSNEELTLKSTRSIHTTISTITTSNDISLLGLTPSTINKVIDENITHSTRPSVIQKIARRIRERR